MLTASTANDREEQDVSHHLKNEGAGNKADAKKTASKPAGASKASAAKKPTKSK
jgi:hypothetical protein